MILTMAHLGNVDNLPLAKYQLLAWNAWAMHRPGPFLDPKCMQNNNSLLDSC